MDPENKNRLGKFIRPEGDEKNQRRKANEIDVSKPSTLIWLTLCYAFVVFFVIIGVPRPGLPGNPIPVEYLPVAIPFFIIAYVVVIGGFYLRDKHRKNKTKK